VPNERTQKTRVTYQERGRRETKRRSTAELIGDYSVFLNAARSPQDLAFAPQNEIPLPEAEPVLTGQLSRNSWSAKSAVDAATLEANAATKSFYHNPCESRTI